MNMSNSQKKKKMKLSKNDDEATRRYKRKLMIKDEMLSIIEQ